MRKYAEGWAFALGSGIAVWFVFMLSAGICLAGMWHEEECLTRTTTAGWILSIGVGSSVSLGMLNHLHKNIGGRLLASLFLIGLAQFSRFVRATIRLPS